MDGGGGGSAEQIRLGCRLQEPTQRLGVTKQPPVAPYASTRFSLLAYLASSALSHEVWIQGLPAILHDFYVPSYVRGLRPKARVNPLVRGVAEHTLMYLRPFPK